LTATAFKALLAPTIGAALIGARWLIYFMKNELQFQRTQRFYMRFHDGKVFFCDRRFRDNDHLDINFFETLDLKQYHTRGAAGFLALN